MLGNKPVGRDVQFRLGFVIFKVFADAFLAADRFRVLFAPIVFGTDHCLGLL